MTKPSDGVPTARCPRCRQPTSLAPDNPWRPFCTERCRMIDFGDWLTGTNALPGEPLLPELTDESEASPGEPFE
jgi:uncharacterized protein